LWRILNRIQPQICIQRAAGLETGEVALYCKFLRKKFVYMIAHDTDVEIDKPEWIINQGLLGSLRWRLFQFGLSHADLIVAQHAGQQERMIKNHHRLSFIRPSSHVIPANIDLKQKQYVLWVARCEQWKQPEVFIRLAEDFPNEGFVMIMPEANDLVYYEKIRNLVRSVRNIKLLDFVSADRIDDYFLHAKIFINTSKSEGFPNTFIQALKTKTPILSYAVNPGNVLAGVGQYAEGKSDKLKEYLGSLLSDATLRQKLGDAGYAYVSDHNNLDKVIDWDKSIINSLLMDEKNI
jgi:glycosyltransferase involved in cell wall biosynthesis